MKSSNVKKPFTLIMILMACFFSGISDGFAEFISPGRLTKSHEELSGLKNCIKCHTLGEGLSDSSCKSCHEKLMGRLAQNKGFHASVEGKCTECHTDHKGEDYDILGLDKEQFDHKKTGYVLRDRHKTSCDKCHKTEKTYLGLSTECSECHTDIHNKTLDADCRKCHDFKSWKSMTFNHDISSKYSLTGKHRDAKCEGCHPEQSVKGVADDAGKTYKVLVFKPLESEKCSDCHFDIHKGELKEKKCSSCHSTEGWKETSFEHNNARLSRYRLEGKHQNVSCGLCHTDEKQLVGLKDNPSEKSAKKLAGIKYGECSNCHFDIHKGQFKEQKCEGCHSVQAEWKQHAFKHESEQYKGYKLEGKHKEASCETCHVRSEIRFSEFNKKKKVSVGTFIPVKSDDCSNCHFDVHKGQFKEQKCEGCHSVENGWKQHAFKHESEQYKGYKLEGKHKEVSCETCHVRSEIRFSEFNKTKKVSAGNFRPLKSDNCNDCHSEAVHGDQFTSNKCENCHVVAQEWRKHIFRHESDYYEGYKLEGKHSQVECEKCHVRSEVLFSEFNKEKKKSVGKFRPLEHETCMACHEDVHKGKYEQKCNDCHTSDSWEPKEFIHDPISFELKGAHRTLTCKQCHEETQMTHAAQTYTGLESDCSSCHRDPHLNQFDQICRDCHAQTAWTPVNFNHAGTGFRLTGTHRTVDCDACHINNNYRNVSTDCYNCHQDDYQSAPNHLSLGYSNDCTECHRVTTVWEEISYSHSSFNFTGAHSAIKNDCSQCHGGSGNNVLAGISDNDCYTCHSISGVASSSYEKAGSPPHASLGFSTSCNDCHSANTWEGARYTHSSFQQKGIHTSLDCSSCHQGGYPGNFAGATEDDCYTCHASDYSQEHPGFPQDCTQCHSGNAWLPASGGHQIYQLRGIHATLSCIACHQSGYPGQYAGTAEDDCYTCHASDHSQQHPTYPQDCTQCHTENAWLPATGFHTSYQLRSIHATLSCIACHMSGYPGQYVGTTEDNCYTCHASDHSQQHPSYPQDCLQCHSENAWLPANFSHQYFNLIYIHATFTCDQCHQTGYPGQYAGISEDDCFACHSDDYFKEHNSQPHDCLQCHDGYTWNN